MAVLKIAAVLALAAVVVASWSIWKQSRQAEKIAEMVDVYEKSYKLLSEQMHAEHAEIVDLLRDGASQRSEMAKQLSYVYNVVKSVRENPDIAEK